MDVLDVSCPDCHARKRKPCVYVEPSALRTPSTEHLYARAGQPTQRPHTARYTKAHWAGKIAARKAREDEYAEQHAVSAEREAILRANAQAVKDEQEQLIAWLRENWLVLTDG